MKKWTIEITEDSDKLSINRVNDGFNTLELLGFSAIIQSDLIEIMKGHQQKKLEPFEPKPLSNKPITVWTFEFFFDEFHRINRTRKIDKARCREYWNKCNFEDRKKSAIKDITKTELTAFEYLKTKLK